MCAPPYRVRRVRADEWRKVRDLRLRALQDPAAAIAFLESREAASERPEEFWRERAAGAAAGRTASQSVAETADGNWVGSATGLLEGPGSDDVEGRPVDHRQVHVVGVWVAAEYRGQGMVDDLIADVLGWACASGVARARMYVHAENVRAQRAYARCGFRPSGVRFNGEIGEEIEMARGLRTDIVDRAARR